VSATELALETVVRATYLFDSGGKKGKKAINQLLSSDIKEVQKGTHSACPRMNKLGLGVFSTYRDDHLPATGTRSRRQADARWSAQRLFGLGEGIKEIFLGGNDG
jgi:hypothetical protein